MKKSLKFLGITFLSFGLVGAASYAAPADAIKRFEPPSAPASRINRFPEFNGTTAGTPWQSDSRFLSSYRTNRSDLGVSNFDDFEFSARNTIRNGQQTKILTNDGTIKNGYFQKQNGKFTELKNGRINDHILRRQHDSKSLDHISKRHVGLNESQLNKRARSENADASSYATENDASLYTSQTISKNQQQIDAWRNSANPKPRKSFESHFANRVTGLHVPAGGGQSNQVSGSRVILELNPSYPNGYRLVTTFPIK